MTFAQLKGFRSVAGVQGSETAEKAMFGSWHNSR